MTSDELNAIKACNAARTPGQRRAQALIAEVELLQAAIRTHRDQRGDDRCWLDDDALYAVLPEGYTPPARDACVELANCEKFIATRHNPGTTYVSPQRRIEELIAEVERLTEIEGYFDTLFNKLCVHDSKGEVDVEATWKKHDEGETMKRLKESVRREEAEEEAKRLQAELAAAQQEIERLKAEVAALAPADY